METNELIIYVIIWAMAALSTAILLPHILPADFKPSTLITFLIAPSIIGLIILGIITYTWKKMK